jgi:hypothetical protein
MPGGNSIHHIVEIGRYRAEQIMASLASRYWPSKVAQLPWFTNAYPHMSQSSPARGYLRPPKLSEGL